MQEIAYEVYATVKPFKNGSLKNIFSTELLLTKK